MEPRRNSRSQPPSGTRLQQPQPPRARSGSTTTAAPPNVLSDILSVSPSHTIPFHAVPNPEALSAAPSGRVQATDFAAVSLQPSLPGAPGGAGSLAAAASTSSSLTPVPTMTQTPIVVAPSPRVQARRPSIASISSVGTADDRRTVATDDDDEAGGSSSFWGFGGGGTAWGGQSMLSDARSVLSDAVGLLDPNAYLRHTEEDAEEGDVERGDIEEAVEEVAGDEALPSIRPGGPSKGRRRESEVSERSSLLSRRTGKLPRYDGGPPQSSAISRITERSAANSWAGAGGDKSHVTIREALTSDSTLPGSNLGLLLIAVSQMCYSSMNLLVVLLDEREGQDGPRGHDRPPLGALEIVAVECFVIWVACTFVMCLFKTEHIFFGPPGVRGQLFVRGVCGFLSTLFLYIALESLTLSDATTISFLGPLATGLMASLLLSEPFTMREKIAGLSSLLGVILIARPAFIFGSRGSGDVPTSGGDSPVGDDEPFPNAPGTGGKRAEARLFGVVVALAGVLCQAGAWTSLRSIGKRASTYHSIAYFSLCSWTLSLAGMLVLHQPFVVPSTVESAFLLAGVGVFSLCAQVFQTLGLQREKAGRAATMSYLQILFATTFQVLLLGTPLETLSLIGSALILANGAWVAAAKSDEDAAVAH